MAAAQVLPLSEVAAYDTSVQADRQAMIDSVLGTMGAEGELPSEETQAVMKSFVRGELDFDEMSRAVFAHATRMVHEANARRLAV